MEQSTNYGNPSEVAQRWAEAGTEWLHVVDLDGAFAGHAQNETAIRSIRKSAPRVKIQVGGGLRSLAAISACFELGINRVILGSAALEMGSASFSPSKLLCDALAKWGPDKVMVSIDAKGGWVATDGWAKTTPIRAVDLAAAVRDAGITTVLYTDIARDGMMTGPDWGGLAQVGQLFSSRGGTEGVIASGGIHTLKDISRLRTIPGVSGAIIGRALYVGAIDLREALDYVSGSRVNP